MSKARTAREPLSRHRVALAALAFIDDHGTEALSMRKLGAELGFEAMSLYNHLANKDDLFDAVGDLLYEEILADYRPDPDAAWQDDVRLMATVYRAAAHRHPRALSLLADRPIPSQSKVLFLERCYRIFTKAGFSVREAARAFDTTASWAVGSIRQELGLMAQLEEQGPNIEPAELPPELHGAYDFMEACLSWTPDQRFAFGLDVLVAGLEAQLASRAPSQRPPK